MLGLNPYLIGGVTALVLALATFGGCQYQRAEKHQARAELAESNTQTAVDANQALTETIERQAAALEKWADLGVTPEKVAAIVDQSSRFKMRAEELAAENNLLRRADSALPECVALLKISLSNRCPNIAAGLLQLSKGSGENRSGGNPGARREATPERDHGRLSTAISVSR